MKNILWSAAGDASDFAHDEFGDNDDDREEQMEEAEEEEDDHDEEDEDKEDEEEQEQEENEEEKGQVEGDEDSRGKKGNGGEEEVDEAEELLANFAKQVYKTRHSLTKKQLPSSICPKELPMKQMRTAKHVYKVLMGTHELIKSRRILWKTIAARNLELAIGKGTLV